MPIINVLIDYGSCLRAAGLEHCLDPNNTQLSLVPLPTYAVCRPDSSIPYSHIGVGDERERIEVGGQARVSFLKHGHIYLLFFFLIKKRR